MTEFRRVVAQTVACRRQFVADETGATALEYSLLVSGIGLTLCAALFATGTNIKEVLYDKIAAALAGM
jgi:Flp pilus assembly pilin Flp